MKWSERLTRASEALKSYKVNVVFSRYLVLLHAGWLANIVTEHLRDLAVDAIPSGDEVTTPRRSMHDQSPDSSVKQKRKRREPIRLATELTQEAVYQQYGNRAKRAKRAKRSNSSVSDDDLSYQNEEESTDEDLEDDEAEEASASDIFSPEHEELTMDDLALESITTKSLKAKYSKMSSQEQENWTPDEMNIRSLLSLSPDRVYTVEDLNNEEILDRGLRILFHARYGQRKQFMRVSPHITYDKLHKLVAGGIEAKLAVEEAQLKSCFDILHP